MEEQKIAVIWIGPSGDNPVLGAVVTGKGMVLSESDFEYFHTHKLVKKAPKKAEKVLEDSASTKNKK